MAIEIVDFSIKNGGSFHSYVSLPEGTERRIIFLAGYLRIATSNITMTENEYMMGKTHEMGGLPPSGLVVTYA